MSKVDTTLFDQDVLKTSSEDKDKICPSKQMFAGNYPLKKNHFISAAKLSTNFIDFL